LSDRTQFPPNFSKAHLIVSETSKHGVLVFHNALLKDVMAGCALGEIGGRIA
jgi:hypothetical protein